MINSRTDHVKLTNKPWGGGGEGEGKGGGLISGGIIKGWAKRFRYERESLSLGESYNQEC